MNSKMKSICLYGNLSTLLWDETMSSDSEAWTSFCQGLLSNGALNELWDVYYQDKEIKSTSCRVFFFPSKNVFYKCSIKLSKCFPTEGKTNSFTVYYTYLFYSLPTLTNDKRYVLRNLQQWQSTPETNAAWGVLHKASQAAKHRKWEK